MKSTNKDLLQQFVDQAEEVLSDLQTELATAALTQMCPQIRELFVEMLMFFLPSEPRKLFHNHYHEWWDDFARSRNTSNKDLLRNMVLLDLYIFKL
jgi:hypothetical protein